MLLFKTSVPCRCSRQSISIPDLFHACVPDFRSMQLFQSKYFRSSSGPCICSRLPFHAVVPDKVFPFQLCSMHLFQTSVPCSVPFPIPFHSVFHSIYSILCPVRGFSNRRSATTTDFQYIHLPSVTRPGSKGPLTVVMGITVYLCL